MEKYWCNQTINLTFNLPNLANRFLEGNGSGYIAAGLPNITGWARIRPYGTSATASMFDGTGAIGTQLVTDWNGGGLATTSNNSNSSRISFDASRSSSIYGNSSTVQPSTCKCYFCIKF